MEELHEADPALDEAARHQALTPEGLGDLLVEAVELLRGLGLGRGVDRLGGAALHAVGELVGRDAGRELRVAGVPGHVHLVEPGQGVEPGPLLLDADALGGLQVDDGVADGAEQRALVGGGHEAGAPVVGAAEGAAAVVVHDHERGQARALRPQAVGDPRADGGEPHPDLAALHLVGRLDVVVRPAVQRPDERHLVDLLREVREDLGHVEAALAVPVELERARHQRAGMALPHDDRLGHRLARVLRQRGLVVERVDLADPAAHEQRDDRGRARLEVRGLRGERVPGDRVAAPVRGRRREHPLAVEHVGEGEPRDAAARLEEEVAAVPERPLPAMVMLVIVHRCSLYLRYRNSFRLSITWVRSTSDCDDTRPRATSASSGAGGRVRAMR